MFGRPHQFRAVALQGLVEHVLLPNATHGCDVFVHYYGSEGWRDNAAALCGLRDVAALLAARAANRPRPLS